MKESFLYYLWENRLLTGTLQTNGKQSVEILNPGYRNTNAGPDFLEAKIKIGEQLWAGHVEIHVKTSDWNRHGHQNDKAYRNVVLHVVYEHDRPVNDIPVLVVKGRFDECLYHRYERFMASQRWIACERQLEEVQAFTKATWLERMAVERLEEKSKKVGKLLEANKFDWEDALYRLVLRYFGLKVNNEAFDSLAQLLPVKTLLKHADNLLQVEAMLLGCAGFLRHNYQEVYPRLLQREFAAMQAKFGLLAMPEERWKFMRMRPLNFPTVRLAQLAQVIHQHGCLFSKIKEAESVSEVKALFDVNASAYWDTHYRFSTKVPPLDRPSPSKGPSPGEKPSSDGPARAKHLGEGTADVLMINAVIPLLFAYGQLHKNRAYCEKALRFLEETDAEDNTIIRHFNALGWTADNAMQSQALLHLYNMYCRRKRCLECAIGNVLLQGS